MAFQRGATVVEVWKVAPVGFGERGEFSRARRAASFNGAWLAPRRLLALSFCIHFI